MLLSFCHFIDAWITNKPSQRILISVLQVAVGIKIAESNCIATFMW